MRERPILFSDEMVRAILDGRKTETRRVADLPHHWRNYRWLGPMDDPRDHALGGPNGNWVGTSRRCPYGAPGDLLYVREAWQGWVEEFEEGDTYAYNAGLDVPYDYGRAELVRFRASPRKGMRRWARWGGDWRPLDDDRPHAMTYLAEETPLVCAPGPRRKGGEPAWKPSIHMPKWASRIWLRVVEVRIERLQEITVSDIQAEGVKPESDIGPMDVAGIYDHRGAYRDAWISLWDSINAGRGYPWASDPWVWVVRFEVVSTTGRDAVQEVK